MKTNILTVSNIAKKYNQKEVLIDVSFSLRSGEVIGLLGPNGAGKTTCFYSVLGLVAPDAGNIFLNDQNITNHPIHQRALAGIGYLPQEPSIFRKLTVSDNILAILETRDDLNKQQRSQVLADLLTEFQINHIANTLGIRLSGGERRRVEIARTIARNPKFVLMDEPFAGIAPIAIQDIKKIIKQLCNKNIGVLITDHNVRDTLAICDKAYIVNGGYIIASGTPEYILANSEVKDVYLGEAFTY
ncbi:MAG: LPS export ABC transporter ATP-binding protein [Gammaproteobacteria bacterium]|nr:LPS export ABC transporter ATP-binding protein [Gammaproteobacteria bacterium]